MDRSALIRASIKRSLDGEEAARERSYRASRELIKSCRETISSMVQGVNVDMGPLREQADHVISEAGKWKFGFVEDSMTEFAEATLLNCVVTDSELPMPEEAGLTKRAYALGACDTVGELRRLALERNIKDDLEGALNYLEKMRELFSIIDGLTYPSGMIQLKRKQDAARAQLDRTLGELTLAKGSRMMR